MDLGYLFYIHYLCISSTRDTELIVYGQTKFDASSLTINGVETKLDKDGRFRIQMALPNGNFPFKVKAISKDGDMVKQIMPVVDRAIDETQTIE